MRSLLTSVLLCISMAAHAADIASVNFRAIRDDLREYYLSKTENAELKKQYDALHQEERKQMEEMQKKIMGGDKSIDISSIMQRGGAASRFDLERKIESDLKKELYLVISGLGLKYELIYDSSEPEAIIFSKSEIADVTSAVKQAITDLQRKK